METVEGHNLGFEALAKVGILSKRKPLKVYGCADALEATLDTRGLLQIRCEGRDHIRFQCGKFQTIEIRG